MHEPAPEQDWSGDDIEQAYLKALHAMQDVGWESAPETEEASPATADSSVVAPLPDGTAAGAAPASPDSGGTAEATLPADAAAQLPVPATSPLPVETAAEPVHKAEPTRLQIAAGTQEPAEGMAAEGLRVTPEQIIEAALFVGGAPLTARRLCSLLGGSTESSFVEQLVDALNTQYADQARPYEIRLGDGGYRLELRAEYERLRHRVQGTGPREVRLSQDVLEVLALVAYKQPVSRPEIEAFSRKNAGNLLRQLLQRELIRIRRGDQGHNDVQYLTSPRFLSVFGLASLDDLPHADDVGVK